MRIDTAAFRNCASQIRAVKSGAAIADPNLYALHRQIQTSLESLAAAFIQMADQAEAAETSLYNPGIWKEAPGKTSTTQDLNLGSQLRKTSVYSTLGVKYTNAWKQGSFTHTGAYHSANASLGVMEFQSAVSGSVKLWKDKKFNPELKGKGEVGLSAMSGTATLMVGSPKAVSVTGKLKGDVGAVYARAETVLSLQEQTLDVAVGAAAARGECSLVFKAFGASVTLTGSGSIASAEAGLSYHHKNREWEFGSKLGFIAGLGFKVKVNY